jgi:hypothetical protein
MLSLPIPKFSAKNPAHQALADLGKQAEDVASSIEIPTKVKFQKARQLLRKHLLGVGVSQRIDHQVAALLRN